MSSAGETLELEIILSIKASQTQKDRRYMLPSCVGSSEPLGDGGKGGASGEVH